MRSKRAVHLSSKVSMETVSTVASVTTSFSLVPWPVLSTFSRNITSTT